MHIYKWLVILMFFKSAQNRFLCFCKKDTIIFCRFAYTQAQVRNKPGREVVTFLLVCNLAMWAINTLETNRADSHPIQVMILYRYYSKN